MKSEEAIFQTQIELLNQAVILIGNRIDQIKLKQIKESEETDIPELEKSAMLAVFKTKSLKLYKDTLNFIATEQSRVLNPKHHYFMLAHVRTLIDVYAKFMHFLINCLNEDQQALTCIAYQLLSYNKLDPQNKYSDTLLMYKNFLKMINYSFPENYNDFDYIWVRDKKLLFANNRVLLSPENINNYASETTKVFKSREIHRIYSSISEMVHGNPYYYNETDSPQKERFWVISMSIIITSLILELTDKYTLGRIKPRDFRDWLDEVSKSKNEFSILWRNINS